ncbi:MULTISPECIES: DUF305 domain-containing protein [Leifsonia]|uniref:DUF305 domain-containing protein n=1 Tax=Leifsonia TaxID=110932 RepID=UPI0028B1A000|nr:DUF305 domain-containing protein [Leifsonia aquatica]
MKFKTMALASGALTTALILAGCANTPTAGHSGMEMGMGSSSTSSATSGHNDADVSFAQSMVMHHQQAIEMSDMVLDKSDVNPKVTELAQKIKDAQKPEIDRMNGWLKTWNASTGMSHDMGGMMSESDMSDLKHASGADAGKLFLTQMITHHQGAIEMANEETKTGTNTDAVALAKKIVTDQTAEIAKMKSLLGSL